MVTYLDRILAAHRAASVADDRDIGGLIEATGRRGAGRGFHAALTGSPGLAVIAEIKRRSPSRGDLAEDLDPAVLAARYAGGGATCLSVLTEGPFFSGSADDLREARRAVDIPVLRKDFTVGPADVCDARLMGADAVLLIAAALSPTELPELVGLAARVGIDALVEVHDEAEAERALVCGAMAIGVNQRDLITFEVDTMRAERVVRMLPDTVVRVAESGICSAEDARRLAGAGFDAILVGEALVTSADPGATVATLAGVRVER